MAETLIVAKDTKENKYRTLLPQIKMLIIDEVDTVANLANVAAAIAETFEHLWVGFYLVKPALKASADREEELVLGPFQGPIACTRIRKGKGVCGTAWDKGKTLVVPDVEAFPGHIACSSLSRSEIVVPIKNEVDEVIGVLDIDSETLNTFDAVDAHYLEKVCHWLGCPMDVE